MKRRVDGLMVRDVGDEVLLLDIESNQVHQLNSTASFIWRNCDDGRSAEEIAILLASEFDVEEDSAREDVTRTLRLLRELNVLE